MGSLEHRLPARTAALVSSALLVLVGCAEITGVDEYDVRDDGNDAPVTACPAGQAPAGEGGECKEVGVVDCGRRFDKDGHGGCTDNLPLGACEPGLIALPRLTQCIAPSSCFPRYYDALPNGTWLYVDAAAQTSGDGETRDTPFKTIMEAVREAAPGTTGIAIAVGEYVETIEIAMPLMLYGACPRATVGGAATILRAPEGSSGPVVHFSSTASSGIVTTLQIVGGAAGIAAEGPTKIVVSGVWIHDVQGAGISLGGGATATANSTLIENALGAGIVLEGATLDAGVQGEISVRGTRTLGDGREGYGVALYPSRDLSEVPISSTDGSYRLTSTPAVSTRRPPCSANCDRPMASCLKTSLGWTERVTPGS